MSAKKQAPQDQRDPASLEDAAYLFAKNGETSRSLAQYIMGVCPTFLDDVPADIKIKLYAGFMLSKHELMGEKHYKLADGGTYIPLPDAKGATLTLTVQSVMSYTTQEYGALNQKDPALRAVMTPIRDAANTYASNNMTALKGTIRALTKGDKPRERTPNKAFRDAMNALFDSFDDRVKTAKARGDTDADPLKYRLARDAFWKAYDAK